MKVFTAEDIQNNRVLLRMDLDVTLRQAQGQWEVAEDFRLQAGLETLELCLEHAAHVTVMGHIGRPGGVEVPELSVEPIYNWLEAQGFGEELQSERLQLLENLRFEPGEEACDSAYAQELASLGDIYINEAFASYHPAASTTVLPLMLPHFAGLRFYKEVQTLDHLRTNAERPFLVIMGGAKVSDKLPVIQVMSSLASDVLVGGKLVAELRADPSLLHQLDQNVWIAELNEHGTDITYHTTERWRQLIAQAHTILWNGPLGKTEDPHNDQSLHIAHAIINSGATSVLGGGDSVAYLNSKGLLDKFTFVSTGGGALLQYLAKGTLPTIEVLNG